jgi:hypothetical protein
VFTRALHWSLSWARSIQSMPSHPISLRSILILSAHLCLGLPSGHYWPAAVFSEHIFFLLYEACPKSIRLYFFPEKPVMAGWQIWSQWWGGTFMRMRDLLRPRPVGLSLVGS